MSDEPTQWDEQADVTLEQMQALVDDTDEARAQRAIERDERSDRPLHEFMTRREFPWHTNRNKYLPHVGVSQMLRATHGVPRSQVRDSVAKFHKDLAACSDGSETSSSSPDSTASATSGDTPSLPPS